MKPDWRGAAGSCVLELVSVPMTQPFSKTAANKGPGD